MFPTLEEYEFIPPPEAPVFEPDEDEWKDPIAYINKIYPYAVKVGICKIRPPPDWQPPFSVDVDKFRFTPRIQKLNELEAKTRVTLNFIDDIAKFWELQGSSIKQPIVEKKVLNLYKLHKIVQKEGGYEDVTRLRRWSRVAMLMGYQTGPASSLLRRHYEKILYPYDVFMSGVMTGDEEQQKKAKGGRRSSKNNSVTKTPTKTPEKEESVSAAQVVDLTTTPDKPSPSKRSPNTPRRSRYKSDSGGNTNIDYTKNTELKKLKFLAPGPKITGEKRMKKQQGQYSKDDYLCDREVAIIQGMTRRKIKKQKENIFDNIANWIDDYKCHVCDNGDEEDSMLLCDICDASYHTFCLLPPLTTVPPGDWRCPKCLAKECSKVKESFGFEQADKLYSLQEFGAHADKFKEEYFSMPAQEVPPALIEKEFWRLVSSIDDNVYVEYGADLHSLEHGSGFPTKENSDDPDDEEYIKSPWNLNNLPNHDKSVLKYINQDISGMKVPWVYIGMCFSSFCWHTEDHWTYSINYCHWGEPKTWYGVPEAYAEKLEDCIKKEAPELFDRNPDLFHHLVTTCSPMTLMNYGVPVVRTNQCAGEFVITFPRAYHAGFNNGYNCAEAVNFCPADWFPIGYRCVEHYRQLKRTFVFSHEELVCKMAAMPGLLDLDVAKKLYENMKAIVDMEVSLRMAVIEKGIKPQYREAFELINDDSRQCSFCKATIFFSCVVCSCNKKRKACLYHFDEICVCQNYKKAIRYRYTLDELPKMLENLKRRADSFDNWEEEVMKAFNASGSDRYELSVFKDLIAEAESSQFPECQLLEQLKAAVAEAEQCGQVASQLLSKKHKTRKTSVSSSGTPAPRLSLEELKEFVKQVQNLPCIIKESRPIEMLMSQVESFRFEANTLLNADDYDPEKVIELIAHSENMDVELPEVADLQMELKAAKWVERIVEILNQDEPISLEAIRSCVDQGIGLRKKQASEQPLSRLKELLYAADKWEEKAKVCLQAKPRHIVSTLEVIVQEAAKVKIALPNVTALREALKTAKEWSTKVDKIQNGEYYPYYEILETLVSQMETQVTATKAWKDRAARTFIRKGSNKTLMELLRPRSEMGKFERKVCTKVLEGTPDPEEKRKSAKCKTEYDAKDKVKGEMPLEEDQAISESGEVKPVVLGIDATSDSYAIPDPVHVAQKFKEEQLLEIAAVKELRQQNQDKLLSENLDAPYCLCQRVIDGFMIRCNLCLEWFHSSCITLPKTVHGKPIGKSQSAWSACREVRYFCSLCSRSRRPRLDTIISLLMALQKLPVRVAEGEAMQFLTERAMNWQDRAKTALARPEIKLVIDKAKDEVERVSTGDKTISTAIAQTVFMHHLLRVRKVQVKAEGGDGEEEVDGAEVDEDKMKVEGKDTELECTEEMSGRSPENILTNLQSATMVGPRSGSPVDICSPQDPMFAANHREEVVTMPFLPESVLDELENLAMEGDLLEVGLDETVHIWAILQIQRPLLKEQCRVMSAEYRRHVLKERKKRNKRKPEDTNFINPCAKAATKTNPTKQSSTNKSTTCAKPITKNTKGGNAKAKCEGKEEEEEEEEQEEQDEDDCCAKPCQKPLGEEVGWVQCDKCEKWYHVICVGISAEEADSIDEYICPDCKPPPPKKKMKKEDNSRSNSPKFSDHSTLAKMTTKLSPELPYLGKKELKSELNLSSPSCPGTVTVMDVTEHARTSITNLNTSVHTSLKKELCDPVVPTDGR